VVHLLRWFFCVLGHGSSQLVHCIPSSFFWVLYFLFDWVGFNSIPNRTKRVYKKSFTHTKKIEGIYFLHLIHCTCLQFPIWAPLVKTSDTPVDKTNQLVKTIDIIHCTCLQLPTSAPQRGPTRQDWTDTPFDKTKHLVKTIDILVQRAQYDFWCVFNFPTMHRKVASCEMALPLLTKVKIGNAAWSLTKKTNRLNTALAEHLLLKTY
jgi:hypothetical protein